MCRRCFSFKYRRLQLPVSDCQPGLQCEDCYAPADHLVGIPAELRIILVDYTARPRKSDRSRAITDTMPESTHGLPKTKEEFVAHLQEDLAELSKPFTFDNVAEILGSTVKHDRAAKIVLFASMLLTYTEEEQVNVLMAAESSAGKSYLPLEISAYFPETDVKVMGGASPQSFFHEVSGGEFATWDPDKKQSRVDLANKILVFLDQPHDQLLQRLRPFLSHDKKEIKYKISDRSQKSGLRTKTIILVGYSTVVFCTAKFDLDQQERTRVFQLSPETDSSKVDAALDLLLQKKSDRDSFREQLSADHNRTLLTRRVLDIKNAGLRDVLIPRVLSENIKESWKEIHPHSIPRHTRDLDRFLSLVKAAALLNWRSRKPASNNRVEADPGDVDEALGVYREIAEANELGLAPQIYEIYKQVIEPIGTIKLSETETGLTSVTRQVIQREYFRLYHRSLPERRLRTEILPPLEASGLTREEQDPADKRRTLVYPQIPGPISTARGVPPEAANNRARQVGVESWTENPPLLHSEVPRTTGSVGNPESPPQPVDQNNGTLPSAFQEIGGCAICHQTRPLRPDHEGRFLICGSCFEAQPTPPEGSS